MHIADYVAARYLSVCSSVRHTPVICRNGRTYLQTFTPSGIHTILVLPAAPNGITILCDHPATVYLRCHRPPSFRTLRPCCPIALWRPRPWCLRLHLHHRPPIRKAPASWMEETVESSTSDLDHADRRRHSIRRHQGVQSCIRTRSHEIGATVLRWPSVLKEGRKDILVHKCQAFITRSVMSTHHRQFIFSFTF